MKQSNRAEYDGIVLGTGLAGLSVAFALCEKGQKVLVVGLKNAKGESSPAAGGILDPLLEMKSNSPLLSIATKSFQRYPKRLREIEKISRVNCGYHPCGMLYVALNSKELLELQQRYSWQKKTKIPVRWISREKLFSIYPNLPKESVAGMFYPTVARVHPAMIVRALIQAIQKKGGQVIEAKKSPKVFKNGNQVAGISLDTIKIKAKFVVNATGAWAGFNKHLSVIPKVEPIRGQILIFRNKDLNIPTILHTLDGGYIVPWGKNEYLAGSTVERVGFNFQTSNLGKKAIRGKVGRLIPKYITQREEKAWAGIRPKPLDGKPWIGETTVRGLYLATGYYRSGVLISFYAGQLLAESILRGKAHKELKPFSPKER